MFAELERSEHTFEYMNTITVLISTLSAFPDCGLERRVLDILPLLVEKRARHWTKGAHGYFTGSYSDSGGSGSSGSGKGLDKSGGSGIIESGSGGMFRKKNPDKIEPMPKKQLRRIDNAF